jgi:hypothetical protein
MPSSFQGQPRRLVLARVQGARVHGAQAKDDDVTGIHALRHTPPAVALKAKDALRSANGLERHPHAEMPVHILLTAIQGDICVSAQKNIYQSIK